jgi:hypothetical protein
MPHANGTAPHALDALDEPTTNSSTTHAERVHRALEVTRFTVRLIDTALIFGEQFLQPLPPAADSPQLPDLVPWR